MITCSAADWYVTAEHPEAPTDPPGILLETRVVFEDGRRRVDQGEALDEDVVMNTMGAFIAEAADPFLDPREDSSCLLEDAARGSSSRAPEIGLEYSPNDIK